MTTDELEPSVDVRSVKSMKRHNFWDISDIDPLDGALIGLGVVFVLVAGFLFHPLGFPFIASVMTASGFVLIQIGYQQWSSQHQESMLREVLAEVQVEARSGARRRDKSSDA